MNIRLQAVDTVFDELEAGRRRVAERAAEMFRERRSAIGDAIDDWLKAERETVWRPALEVVRTGDAFVVQVAAAGVDPEQFDVRVTPTELLVAADVHHSDRDTAADVMVCEFATGPLFRSYAFPEPVEPSRVTAEYRNGLLRVVAPLAVPQKRVSVHAA
jgi:HSP20 family protein